MMDDHLEVNLVVLDLSLGELLGRLADSLNVGDLVPETDVRHFPDGIHTNQWLLQARHGRNISCSITSTSSQVHHPVLSETRKNKGKSEDINTVSGSHDWRRLD